MDKRIAARWAFGIALMVIVLASLLPYRLVPLDLPGHDKQLHVLSYLALAVLGAMGWPQRRLLFLVGLPVLGLAFEVMQGAGGGRSFEWSDAIANGVGVGLGVMLIVVLARWFDRR